MKNIIVDVLKMSKGIEFYGPVDDLKVNVTSADYRRGASIKDQKFIDWFQDEYKYRKTEGLADVMEKLLKTKEAIEKVGPNFKLDRNKFISNQGDYSTKLFAILFGKKDDAPDFNLMGTKDIDSMTISDIRSDGMFKEED